MGFISFKKTPLAPRFISLQIPYLNIVTPAFFITAQATLLLRPILLFIVNGALMPLLRPILLFIVNGALIFLLRPILLFIVNGVLMPPRCYKTTSLQYFLPLSTSIPILICLKYSLLPIYL
jgi:hypothetical protein